MKKIISLMIILLILMGCSSAAETSNDNSLIEIMEKETFIVATPTIRLLV